MSVNIPVNDAATVDPIYQSRQHLENEIMFDISREVKTQGTWKAAQKIIVHKLTVGELEKYEGAIEELSRVITVSTAKTILEELAKLDDNSDIFQLLKFYQDQLIKPSMGIICACCKVEDEDVMAFKGALYLEDFLAIFWEIIDLHLYDPRVRALQKKTVDAILVRTELEEKFRNFSESSPDIN